MHGCDTCANSGGRRHDELGRGYRLCLVFGETAEVTNCPAWIRNPELRPPIRH